MSAFRSRIPESRKDLSAEETSATYWGLGLLGVLLIFFLVSSGTGMHLIHLPSLILVVGGTIGATLLTFPWHDILTCWRDVQRVTTTGTPCVEQRLLRLVGVARRARKEGMLVLEGEASRESDPFFKHALTLVVDEKDPDRLRALLMAEMETTLASMKRSANVLLSMASYAPAIGFVGTLLGLLSMLETLGDASRVGPAMALALVATLYGTLLAHVVLIPLAGRLRSRAEDELRVKQATLEGLTGLAVDENVVLIEQRVAAFRRG